MQAEPPKCQNFFGAWRLLPESCIYDVGKPPKKGLYTISKGKQEHEIDINIQWTDEEDSNKEYSYSILTDGTPTTSTFGGVTLRVVSHRDMDCRVLKSTSSTLQGNKIMESTRQLLERGKKMEVVMTTFNQEKTARIYQLYERVQQ